MQKTKCLGVGVTPLEYFPAHPSPLTPYLSRHCGRDTPEWWAGAALGPDSGSLQAWGGSSEPGHLDIKPKRWQKWEEAERTMSFQQNGWWHLLWNPHQEEKKGNKSLHQRLLIEGRAMLLASLDPCPSKEQCLVHVSWVQGEQARVMKCL